MKIKIFNSWLDKLKRWWKSFDVIKRPITSTPERTKLTCGKFKRYRKYDNN